MTSCCWSLSSWPAGWPLSEQQNPMITPSHYPHTGRLTAFHWERFNRPLEFSFTLTLSSRLYFPGMQLPNRPILKSAMNCNCDICIYDMKLDCISCLTMLVSLNNELLPSTFVVVVTTQTVNRCFSSLNRHRRVENTGWMSSVARCCVKCSAVMSGHARYTSRSLKDLISSLSFLLTFCIFLWWKSNAHLCPFLLLLSARQSEISASVFSNLHSPR